VAGGAYAAPTGVRGARRSRMRVAAVVAVVLVASCGGEVAGTGEGTGTGSPTGTRSGSGSGTGCPCVWNGYGPNPNTTSPDCCASDAGTTDAAVACTLPPPNGGGAGTQLPCTFCDNAWYCPQPRMPEPQCSGQPALYEACTSDCITCGAPPGYCQGAGCQGAPFANTAWFWQCNNGEYGGSSDGWTCTPP
jgi:hypothetical protein